MDIAFYCWNCQHRVTYSPTMKRLTKNKFRFEYETLPPGVRVVDLMTGNMTVTEKKKYLRLRRGTWDNPPKDFIAQDIEVI